MRKLFLLAVTALITSSAFANLDMVTVSCTNSANEKMKFFILSDAPNDVGEEEFPAYFLSQGTNVSHCFDSGCGVLGMTGNLKFSSESLSESIVYEGSNGRGITIKLSLQKGQNLSGSLVYTYPSGDTKVVKVNCQKRI